LGATGFTVPNLPVFERMADRYFANQQIQGDRAVLSGPEAHHLLHVMRAKVGDELLVFDGSGAEYVARIERLSRSDAQLAILQRTEVDRELSFTLTLGIALPKGDRQKWLVEKAAELGVTRIVPLQTGRGVAQPTTSTLERLRRTVIEASKQCGRNRLLEISEAESIDAFLRRAASSTVRVFAHPGSQTLSEVKLPPSAAEVYCAIGPEGGFTDDEAAQAIAAGWQAVGLGPRILRVETAALALATWAAVGMASGSRK
jgi:16S rRNA (uracil1498-N3)-methyltransferase